MRTSNDSRGFIVASIMITVTFITMIAIIITQIVTLNYQQATREQQRLQSQLSADTGADYGIYQLNQDSNWTGTGSEIELFNDGVTRTTYEVVVVNGSEPEDKTLQVIGRSYRPASSSTPSSERKYEVAVEGLGTAGNFSIVTGVGGLYMANSAKIVAGDVYVNGEISMSNTAQIGLESAPVSVKAAHQNCPSPPDGTYPRVCNSGENGEPITLTNSAHIYADVSATNQTSGSGMSHNGLIPNQTVPPLALPDHDRDAQKAAATNTMTSSQASCSGTQSKTWPANSRVTGNVTLSNNCQITIQGDIWIEGNLYVSNSSKIIVADSAGTTQPVVMVDGSQGVVLSNAGKVQANSQDTGVQIITYYSQASCSPDCSDVIGSDLYNSRDRTTISLSNNSEAPESVLYARWTQVLINNGGNIGAVVGQTVRLSNSAAITFGTSVPGSGGDPVWVVRSYKRVY